MSPPARLCKLVARHVEPSGRCPGRHEDLRGRGGLCAEHGARLAALWWARRESPKGAGEAEAAAEEVQQAGANLHYPGEEPGLVLGDAGAPPPPGGGVASRPTSKVVRLRRRGFYSSRMGRLRAAADTREAGTSAPLAVRGRKRKRRHPQEGAEEDEAGAEREDGAVSRPRGAAVGGPSGGGGPDGAPPGALPKWPSIAPLARSGADGGGQGGGLPPGISAKAPPGALPKRRGAPGGGLPPESSGSGGSSSSSGRSSAAGSRS